ncbi:MULTISPECIES: NAD(P)/FAD-dependent oxidoreductase [unclassified Oceanispirochaeta]|uniref:FAD-dependent oxidoreductase n=1 Tax=unclassified Oceanispirochaeta TaxID=2635722 RepID=UPI0013143BD5|nr:NAD(P)/FAD-dependent oxidoreductase [Oceanispirochaeta sp. M1]MBF9016759.1 NAD(P)/FAD-dependent oxidoreductase [Oceanispirochaeta sp. M2]NPD72029.1 NAD(P)/FAD-dependent oxidoreductase [Oceanispirochaeta sp. M1]
MQYDVLVLGSGPAGFYSALSCGRNGLKTALVERDIQGGTGLATGCLPVKMILDRIKLLRETGVPERLPQVLNDSRERMNHLGPLMNRRLMSAGVDLYTGEGFFLSADSFKVDDTILSARSIILATGTEPGSLPGVSDHPNCISHKEAVSLSRPPGSLTIVGGDVEGIEFASLFSELGTSVTVLEQQSEILTGYDRDLVQPIADRLKDNGVSFKMDTRVTGSGEKGELLTDSQSINPSGPVLITGIRRPSFPEGLAAAGVECLKDRIPVNGSLRTNVPHIFAVGDINGLLGMGSAAVQQGMQMGDFLKDNIPITLDQGGLPRAVFSLPEIAGAGQQEKDLIAAGIPYGSGQFPFNHTWRGMGKWETGFVKVLVTDKDRLAGLWMSGQTVSETAGFCGPVLDAGIGLSSLRKSLMIHPVLGEAVLEACNQIHWE